jgi:hypothetical protein
MTTLIPPNFDGTKFIERYGDIDFRVIGDELICPSLPNLTTADIADLVVDMVAYNNEKQDYENSITALRNEFTSTISTLTDIENATSPTNAQVIAAIKFLAKTLRLLLKVLARQLKI